MSRGRGHRARRYAVYSHQLVQAEYDLSIEEAFCAMMKLCRFEPVWNEDGEDSARTITLQFRHSDGPLIGQLVGKFTAPFVYSMEATREEIILKVGKAGLRGWFTNSIEAFDLERGAAEQRIRSPREQRGPPAR